jgi:hypothetical protein
MDPGSNRHAYADTNTDRDANSNGYSDCYTNANSNRNCYGDASAESNSNGNVYRDANLYSKTYTDTEIQPVIKTSAYSAAETLIPSDQSEVTSDRLSLDRCRLSVVNARISS